MKKKPIYVEIEIDSNIDNVWNASQDPDLHSQWDLRFSSITYLPKKDGEPQKFTYKRSVTPLFTVAGWGKSIGTFNKGDGTRSSSLHFGTDQWLSPIKEGKGYWKYEPRQEGTTFLTQYDYDPNFGSFGKAFDAFIFHPIIGWGTALSFDVLKRWLEKGEAPRSQYFRFFSTYGLAILFSFIWIYHGILPKIIGNHPEERRMLASALPLEESKLTAMMIGIGVAEVLLGILWLIYQKRKHLFALQLAVFPLLTVAALIAAPDAAMHPFNPVTFNLSLFVLSLIGYCTSEDVPTAKSCKRKR
ncbi:DoxX-like family protein [Sporosarcina luteola]|uniref:DoxX-like family protein n=1 Tax=Sporosarcina luteola TaxID=582850 RepID=UPI00203EC592|nr:DoxX-like family protein [Sporosarcina luteola]MCM3710205.1 DoxX-like family protein [Sporosarcina luteola]